MARSPASKRKPKSQFERIIVWRMWKNTPQVMAIFDEIFVSSGALNHDTYESFVRKVGRSAAEQALSKYEKKQRRGDDRPVGDPP
jgi:hypothetical protein